MMTLINTKFILLIVYISIIAHNAYSISLYDRRSADKTTIKPYLIDDISSSIDEHRSKENSFPAQIHPFLNKRRSDSAERYFDWATKTNRPMEYWRGKRFWLFPNKDEHVNNHGTIPKANTSNHGIWRSGIVGRRSKKQQKIK